MKRRRVPNTISKRLRRKLRRAKNPYLLWLRLRRPAVYHRLVGLWWVRLLNQITSISPIDTPLFALAPRDIANSIIDNWKVDP
jgi:hypothetical protein